MFDDVYDTREEIEKRQRFAFCTTRSPRTWIIKEARPGIDASQQIKNTRTSWYVDGKDEEKKKRMVIRMKECKTREYCIRGRLENRNMLEIGKPEDRKTGAPWSNPTLLSYRLIAGMSPTKACRMHASGTLSSRMLLWDCQVRVRYEVRSASQSKSINTFLIHIHTNARLLC